ncbi:MAG: ComEC/Rec2 family competence protein, partial [Crocinitomicaceae bacterium]|nr:ComEC/Rec2 family competence protein [Crocinitomicaceae bacterium]
LVIFEHFPILLVITKSLLLYMRFFERPFIFITLLFAAGLLLGDLFEWSYWMSIPMVLFLIWSIIRVRAKKSTNPLFYALAIGGFLYAGVMTMRTDRTTYSMSRSGDFIHSIIGEITEVDNSRKLWSKCIFTVSGIVEEDGIRAHNEKLVCYVSATNLELHDKLFLRKAVYAIKNNGNPGEFDSKSFWNNKGLYATVFVTPGDFKVINKVDPPFYERWRNYIKGLFEDIFSSHLEGDELAIASALVLGDKSLLSQDVRESFGAAGAMHVLAVSGLHVGIILELLLFLFGRMPKIFTKKRALLISLIILWAYAMVIGFPPSVVRATLMFSFLSVSRLSSDQSDSLNTLFLSALVMLIFDPLLIYDIGFQLSYLAMIGILTLQKPIANLIYIRNKWLKKLWEGTTVGIAAQLFTFPLTLYYFHQFPNYFLLTNIGMMIFAGIVLSFGLILLSINWIGVVGKFVAIGFGFTIAAMLFFVQWIEGLPWSLANGFVLNPWAVLFAYILLVSLLVFRKHKTIPKIAIGLGLVLLVFIQFDRYSRMTKQEITLFNSSYLIIAMQDGPSTTFFYSCPPAKIDKVKFICKGYLKANGTKGKFKRLKRGITTFKFRNKRMTFDMSNLGVLVTRFPDEKQFYVRTTLRAPYLENMTNFTMNYLPATPDAVGLVHGAYSMPLLD